MSVTKTACRTAEKCGGCRFSAVPYINQLATKQDAVNALFEGCTQVLPILGMEEPLHYRNKVHHVFARMHGETVSGIYAERTHQVIPAAECLVEDALSQEIIRTVTKLANSFKLRVYDEDRETGFLRHVLVRRGFESNEVLVVLVTAEEMFPGKKDFVKALVAAHPEITSIVQNLNKRATTMVLGNVNKTLFGPGYITDVLCGKRFRISPNAFYQVNSKMAEVLYRTVAEFAGLTGRETVVDAYSGVGTIGLTLAGRAKEVIGVELNQDAVRDAVWNAKANGIENATFIADDAGRFLTKRAAEGAGVDVLVLDPPRSGSTEAFLRAAAKARPKRIVYVSCNPETLLRDMKILKRMHYRAEKLQPVDMFPFTEEIESVALLTPVNERKRMRPQ